MVLALLSVGGVVGLSILRWRGSPLWFGRILLLILGGMLSVRQRTLRGVRRVLGRWRMLGVRRRVVRLLSRL